LSPRADERRLGSVLTSSTGEDCWYFLPRRLAHGTTAPVVVFLHGFALLAPDIYDRHIEHLSRQGVIVVYPQINKGGLLGLLSDFDQNAMLDRAVRATNRCLAAVGDRADFGHVYLYGHSLGGLLAAVWQSHPDAVAARAAVLANPATDSFAGIPPFVLDIIRDALIPIDWRSAVQATDIPVVLLTGDADTIAPSDQAVALRGALVRASTRLYAARSDRHARDGLIADHMAPINNSGVLPDFLMSLFGGAARTDALDYRFYWAALDAVMDGQVALAFDMGTWSDGVPAASVDEL
jgi:dienelactone hydrolase